MRTSTFLRRAPTVVAAFTMLVLGTTIGAGGAAADPPRHPVAPTAAQACMIVAWAAGDTQLLAPGYATFSGGTRHDDVIPAAIGSPGQTPVPVWCGFTGDDVVSDSWAWVYGGPGNDGIGENWLVFRGGLGDDSVSPNEAYFDGGPGNDSVIANHGTFDGGLGDDSVIGPQGPPNAGTFNGGPGDDRVDWNAATFNGGSGNDTVGRNDGTFDGGPGFDVVTENHGTCVNVEVGC